MTRKLFKALKKQKDATEQVALQIYGTLGIPLGGQKLVEVPNRNAFVFVKLRDNQNEVIQAYNNQVATSYGLPVKVQRQGNRYIVLGVDTERYQNMWNSNSPFLPKHGGSHSFNLGGGGGGDVTWVYSQQMMPLLVYPTSTTGAWNANIAPHTLLDTSGRWRSVGNTGTISFQSFLPTGASAVMGLIYLDATSGNPGVLIASGSYFPNTITGSLDIYAYIPTPNIATQIPLTAVRLDTGTYNIGWENLYDVRQWVSAVPTGTSSGGGSSSGTTINIWDEGIFKGTADTLNVVGSLADISVSGTVARLFITGSTSGGTVNPPITGSFVVQNNGLTLGSATILNFTNGVTASISGSTAQIQVTGTASYVRTAPPLSLSTVTGTYWKTQEGIFLSGSLALFNQGHALIPSIDYLEQYPTSGTFQYISTPPTGTYNLAIYGVPVAGGNSGGSGGGGGGFTPSHYPIPIMFPDSNTNFNTIDATGASDYYLLSSGAQDDNAKWNMNLPAGTYTWTLFHFRGSNRGKYHLLLDGADIGTQIDGYNAGGDYVASSVTTITVSGGSPTEVQIKMASKNASSAAYYGLIFQSWLIRTGN